VAGIHYDGILDDANNGDDFGIGIVFRAILGVGVAPPGTLLIASQFAGGGFAPAPTLVFIV